MLVGRASIHPVPRSCIPIPQETGELLVHTDKFMLINLCRKGYAEMGHTAIGHAIPQCRWTQRGRTHSLSSSAYGIILGLTFTVRGIDLCE